MIRHAWTVLFAASVLLVFPALLSGSSRHYPGCPNLETCVRTLQATEQAAADGTDRMLAARVLLRQQIMAMHLAGKTWPQIKASLIGRAYYGPLFGG